MSSTSLDVPDDGDFTVLPRPWLAALRVTLGASRTVITLPIYLTIAAALIMPIGYLLVVAVPARGAASFFDGFLGSFIVAPSGFPQKIVAYFYFALYLMSYLSIASVVGYEERRDRSIMFWKSLPVSDATWVIAQTVTLFVGYLIGLSALLVISIVITAWEALFYIGLNNSSSGYLGYLFKVIADLFSFAFKSMFILFLGMPFGVSIFWFAAFCRRQPSGYWLATFASLYLLAYMVRFIGFDFVEPILWYPETFADIALGILRHDKIPSSAQDIQIMILASAVSSFAFGLLAWRARRMAMPVA